MQTMAKTLPTPAASKNVNDANTAISASGIIRDFKAGQSTIRVLHGIDAEIRSGEMTYVVGESGSGKSQIALAIMG